MTTKTTVFAGHGWPVDVTVVPTGTDQTKLTTTRVPANQTQDFYVHSGQDLLIHEVQPAEIAAEVEAEKAKATSEADTATSAA